MYVPSGATFGGAPVYSRTDQWGLVWSLYRRASGMWVFDFNGISEEWSGTVAHSRTLFAASVVDATWNRAIVIVHAPTTATRTVIQPGSAAGTMEGNVRDSAAGRVSVDGQPMDGPWRPQPTETFGLPGTMEDPRHAIVVILFSAGTSFIVAAICLAVLIYRRQGCKSTKSNVCVTSAPTSTLRLPLPDDLQEVSHESALTKDVEAPSAKGQAPRMLQPQRGWQAGSRAEQSQRVPSGVRGASESA